MFVADNIPGLPVGAFIRKTGRCTFSDMDVENRVVYDVERDFVKASFWDERHLQMRIAIFSTENNGASFRYEGEEMDDVHSMEW